jgi:hypothetical protein
MSDMQLQDVAVFFWSLIVAAAVGLIATGYFYGEYNRHQEKVAEIESLDSHKHFVSAVGKEFTDTNRRVRALEVKVFGSAQPPTDETPEAPVLVRPNGSKLGSKDAK